MLSSDDISKNIRNQLKIIDPDLSVEPLTVERKIVDSVAQAISDVEIDKYILQYQMDIDTKVGIDLDRFVALFGFARQGGSLAVGQVIFTTNAAATSNIFIPAGTLVSTQASSLTNSVTFATTASVIMYQGTTSVSAPIECTNVGKIGNVPANTIVQFGATGLDQISGLSNPIATSGGTEVEDDATLRLRFKNTIFRNIAGTKSQYLALAIASKYTNRARVLGPIDRFTEYLQVPTNLIFTSTIPYSKYTYNFDYYVTQGSLDTEQFFNPNVDYTFSNSVPPVYTIIRPDTEADFNADSIVYTEHSYNSINSRNSPSTNISNYIDVYVDGENPITANEATVFPDTTVYKFTSSSGSIYWKGNYQRTLTGITPTVGNILQQLIWQPVTALPDSMTINGVTFTEEVDYFLVRDLTTNKGSKRARNGIEWTLAAAGTIISGTAMDMEYTFNKEILTLNELMEEHKQVGSDVLVHAAVKRYFNVNLVVMYDVGASKVTVDAGINNALIDFFNGMDFGASVQISDITEIVHEVPGVDNVRVATASDKNSAYGIQEVALNGVTHIGQPYTSDFMLQDCELPVFNSVTILRRSVNTY